MDKLDDKEECPCEELTWLRELYEKLVIQLNTPIQLFDFWFVEKDKKDRHPIWGNIKLEDEEDEN